MFHKQKFKPIKPLKNEQPLGDKPYWYNSFVIRGYTDKSIPKTPPPNSNNYGEILTWITNDQFELEEDVSFAIEIWLGECDLNEELPKEDSQKDITNPSPSFW